MMATGSVEAVIAAVREDAAAETERIDRDLAAAVARLRAEDAAMPIVVADAEARLTAARRTVRDRLAAEDVADHQTALRDREEWMRQVQAAGERALSILSPAELNSDLLLFIREAISRVPEPTLDVLVPVAQLAAAEQMRSAGALAAEGKTIGDLRPTSELAFGCIVQTADGRFRYENSYRTRAVRLEAVCRSRLGELYEQSARLTVGIG